MKDSEYNPDVLVSFDKKDERDYVLGVLPSKYDEDFFYEIFISTPSAGINNLIHSIGRHIYVEITSSNLMEIWEGEFVEECSSDGKFEYISYSRKRTKKANQVEWKPKVKKLDSLYRALFNEKLKPYGIIRVKIIDNFKNIFDTEISKLKKEKRNEFLESSLFNILYRTYDSNPAWDTFNKLLDPEFKYYPPTPKDWKEEHLKLEQKFNRLNKTDTENYTLINDHMIDMYKKTFDYMLPSFLINYPDSDQESYKDFFNTIMKNLKNYT